MKLVKPSTLLALAAFGVWFLMLRPIALGGPAGYEVVTGTSMEPRLHTGDLVISQIQGSYAIGDLVVFRVPKDAQGGGALVVHRLVGGDGENGFVTKGDNRPAPDVWHPKYSDIIGQVWIELPGSGAVLLAFRRPLVLAALLGGVVGFWILTSGPNSPSTAKGGEAGGRMVWMRRRNGRLTKVAAPSWHPAPSLTPIRDMRERSAKRVAQR